MTALEKKDKQQFIKLGGTTKADLNFSITSDGVFPLLVVSAKGDLEFVDLMLQNQNLDINRTDEYGVNAFWIAAFYNHVELMRKLYDEGIDIESKNHNGSNALHIAAKKNNIKIIQELIDMEFPLDTVKNNGITALGIAAFKGYMPTLKLLVENGANIQLQSKNGIGALQLAIKNNQTEAVANLVGKGVELYNNDPQKIDQSAIFLAIKAKNLDIVKLLCSKAGPTEVKKWVNAAGQSAVQLAAMVNQPEIVNYLVSENFADLHEEDVYKQTLLQKYALEDNIEMVKKLMQECRIPIDQQNSEGKTALMLAIEKQNKKVVEHLLKMGASPQMQDNDKKTVSQYAKDYSMTDEFPELKESAKPPELIKQAVFKLGQQNLMNKNNNSIMGQLSAQLLQANSQEVDNNNFEDYQGSYQIAEKHSQLYDESKFPEKVESIVKAFENNSFKRIVSQPETVRYAQTPSSFEQSSTVLQSKLKYQEESSVRIDDILRFDPPLTSSKARDEEIPSFLKPLDPIDAPQMQPRPFEELKALSPVKSQYDHAVQNANVLKFLDLKLDQVIDNQALDNQLNDRLIQAYEQDQLRRSQNFSQLKKRREKELQEMKLQQERKRKEMLRDLAKTEQMAQNDDFLKTTKLMNKEFENRLVEQDLRRKEIGESGDQLKKKIRESIANLSQLNGQDTATQELVRSLSEAKPGSSPVLRQSYLKYKQMLPQEFSYTQSQYDNQLKLTELSLEKKSKDLQRKKLLLIQNKHTAKTGEYIDQLRQKIQKEIMQSKTERMLINAKGGDKDGSSIQRELQNLRQNQQSRMQEFDPPNFRSNITYVEIPQRRRKSYMQHQPNYTIQPPPTYYRPYDPQFPTYMNPGYAEPNIRYPAYREELPRPRMMPAPPQYPPMQQYELPQDIRKPPVYIEQNHLVHPQYNREHRSLSPMLVRPMNDPQTNYTYSNQQWYY